jgi:3-oxoacyl-[acyl-carrier-protein] synthase III
MEPPLTPRSYDGVARCCPITEPYVRRSERDAAWFLARALRRLITASGIAKPDIGGVCASSPTPLPDTAVNFTQQVGLSPRVLEWLPMGGACGATALRRPARAVQAGGAEIVACIAGDTSGGGGGRRLPWCARVLRTGEHRRKSKIHRPRRRNAFIIAE